MKYDLYLARQLSQIRLSQDRYDFVIEWERRAARLEPQVKELQSAVVEALDRLDLTPQFQLEPRTDGIDVAPLLHSGPAAHIILKEQGESDLLYFDAESNPFRFYRYSRDDIARPFVRCGMAVLMQVFLDDEVAALAKPLKKPLTRWDDELAEIAATGDRVLHWIKQWAFLHPAE